MPSVPIIFPSKTVNDNVFRVNCRFCLTLDPPVICTKDACENLLGISGINESNVDRETKRPCLTDRLCFDIMNSTKFEAFKRSPSEAKWMKDIYGRMFSLSYEVVNTETCFRVHRVPFTHITQVRPLLQVSSNY